MSQQGGWGPPPGQWGNGAPGAPGGYGPPQQGAGGYGPPQGGGGGYGPPGAPGGYGPPGAPPGAPGGYGPPGAPPGGYGPPPGGGNYGPPPGGGYGPPPGGGFGAPPPGGGFVPGGGGPMMGGGRASFSGDGGELFKTMLLYYFAPFFGAYVVLGSVVGGAFYIDQQARANGMVAGPVGLVSGLILLAVVAGVVSVFLHKLTEFTMRNTRLDGQTCEYRGTLGNMAKMLFVNILLTNITFGIYFPWAYVNYKKFVYANTLVNGQPNRLTFTGSAGDLLGKYILGSLLTYCTLGIYMFWFMNDIFAFQWENTQLDGRPFRFNRDPGGLFGALILNYLLTYCTLGIYAPWMMCNLLKWEAEHVS